MKSYLFYSSYYLDKKNKRFYVLSAANRNELKTKIVKLCGKSSGLQDELNEMYLDELFRVFKGRGQLLKSFINDNGTFNTDGYEFFLSRKKIEDIGYIKEIGNAEDVHSVYVAVSKYFKNHDDDPEEHDNLIVIKNVNDARQAKNYLLETLSTDKWFIPDDFHTKFCWKENPEDPNRYSPIDDVEGEVRTYFDGDEKLIKEYWEYIKQCSEEQDTDYEGNAVPSYDVRRHIVKVEDLPNYKIIKVLL